MRTPHTSLMAVGATVALVAVGLAAQPAQAAITAQGRGTFVRLPAAPARTGMAAPGSLSAVSPGISPATRTTHVSANGGFVCADGNLCTSVWDPTTGTYKIFFMYSCATYALSGWVGGGRYYDSQTGSVVSTFYGQSRNTLTTFKAAHQTVDYTWDPVYYIKNC